MSTPLCCTTPVCSMISNATPSLSSRPHSPSWPHRLDTIKRGLERRARERSGRLRLDDGRLWGRIRRPADKRAHERAIHEMRRAASTRTRRPLRPLFPLGLYPTPLIEDPRVNTSWWRGGTGTIHRRHAPEADGPVRHSRQRASDAARADPIGRCSAAPDGTCPRATRKRHPRATHSAPSGAL